MKQKQSEVRQGASCAGRLKAKANIEEKEMYGHPAAVETMVEIFGEAISTYTRAQAIEDGVLVDVSEIAKEAGFKFPVAVTRAAWADCVEWSDEDNKLSCTACRGAAVACGLGLWCCRCIAGPGTKANR